MEHRRDDAARFELVIKPEPIEHFQRCGMIGAGTRHLFEEIIVAERLDKADLQACLRQCQRQAEPDRPGADDNNTIWIVWAIRLSP